MEPHDKEDMKPDLPEWPDLPDLPDLPELAVRKTATRPEKKLTAPVDVAYCELSETYDRIINSFLETLTSTCADLVIQCKIPLIKRNHSEKVFDETDQDSRYKQLVLETYLEALDDVQSGQEKSKRAIHNLPRYKVDVLREWCVKNLDSPYPEEKQKEEWSKQLDITVSQISQWFSNYRKRVWRPHRRYMNMK